MEKNTTPKESHEIYISCFVNKIYNKLALCWITVKNWILMLFPRPQRTMKAPPNFVQTELLPNLLCAKCKRVLSQFPVYCYSEGSSCGRCPYPENGIRNEAYEVLAQNVRFPCCHNEHGCLENLLPKDVAKHEKLCSFRKYNCPIKSHPACDWKGFFKDLLDHFEQKHPVFVLSEHSFEVNFVNSADENYVFPYGEALYLVNLRTDSKKHTYFCTVSYVGNDPHDGDSNYRIIFENSNKTTSHEICGSVNTTTRVDRDIISGILNDPISIIARIEIFKEAEIDNSMNEDDEEQEESINYQLLQELECLVCMEYMIPPIHQCVTGHSICLNCKESLSECPTCRKEFTNTQNFVLAQIIQHIDYPCKHPKCKFTCKAKDIRQHEATCVFSPYECPLNDYTGCDYKMQFEEIYSHIVKEHYEHLLEIDIVSIPFPTDEDNDASENLLEDCFIIKYGSKLFKLHFYYNDNEFMFATQLIGPTEQCSKYRFEIDILDSKGTNYRAYMTNSCGALTHHNFAFDDNKPMVLFTYDQISRLISDQLCFRIRISEN